MDMALQLYIFVSTMKMREVQPSCRVALYILSFYELIWRPAAEKPEMNISAHAHSDS